MIDWLFLIAPVLAVPMGLALLNRQTRSVREAALLRWARRVQPAAALGVVISFAFLPGRSAAIWVLPWFLFGILLGILALVRLIGGGWRFPAPLCYTAALAYFPVGAAWLLASRAGWNPMGYGEPIVLLTAVHFHFSGFAASILAAEVTRRAHDFPKTGATIACGALLGTPLIAAGFVFLPLLKAAAILFFATTLAVLAVVQLRIAMRMEARWTKGLLGLSSVSILLGMTLACIYGITDFRGWPLISIPQMARTHGILNAFGFTLCGLLGWITASQEDKR